MRIRFQTVVLLGLVTGSVAIAAPQVASKGEPAFSASVKFVNLPGARVDTAFNEAIFTDQVRASLDRAGISVDANKRGKFHLSFEVDYVYHPGDVDYRFATVRVAGRNKADHAVCDVSQSFWWGGPSGRNQLGNTVESTLSTFAQRCLPKK